MFALTFLSALGASLVAGIFFAFSAFIMSALGCLSPAGGISAMQSINVVVLNPLFFAGQRARVRHFGKNRHGQRLWQDRLRP